MFISALDLFKVGIGPSSSHTMGPMIAAARFLDTLRASPFSPAGIRAHLHGSLAFTGVGHATGRAVILGLAGFVPDSYDRDAAESALARVRAAKAVTPEGLGRLAFDPGADLVFDRTAPLPGHANGMRFCALDAEGDVIRDEIYYSIGGGFVLTDAELAKGRNTDDGPPVPYPFHSAAEMLAMCRETGRTVAALKRANEVSRMCSDDLDRGLARIWEVMSSSIDRGLGGRGVLPGSIGVKRRAAKDPRSTSRRTCADRAPEEQISRAHQ